MKKKTEDKKERNITKKGKETGENKDKEESDRRTDEKLSKEK
jgi:hypothetical protein